MRKLNAMLISLIPLINTPQTLMQRIAKLGLILMMGVYVSACSDSWKEEVLLHDGSKIIVERTVVRGGMHEIGQQSPIKEQSLSFRVPATQEIITWKTRFSEDVGFSDFKPIQVDIIKGQPYLVAVPMGCLAYNKWGRPNPPYVVFKYESKKWKRITLQELPTEITRPNLIISSPDNEAERIGKSVIAAEAISNLNNALEQSEYKSILREPIKPNTWESAVNCREMVHYKCGWTGVDVDGSFNTKQMDRLCNISK